jgi:hypothetical protein
MRPIKSLQNTRWFIWTIVAIVVVLGGLAVYIFSVSQSWEGKWAYSYLRDDTILTISSSTPESFNFHIFFQNGENHSGSIFGTAFFVENTDEAIAVIPDEFNSEPCRFDFKKTGHIISLEHNKSCYDLVGTGVGFSGKVFKLTK